MRQPKIPMMTEASEYDGQSEIAVSCTQLGTAYTASLAKKVVRALTDLELGGAWRTPRNGHVSSIQFLTDLPQLEKVLLHTLVVDDLDYTPLLHLPRLRSVRVMKMRGMQPSHDELRRQLPWSA